MKQIILSLLLCAFALTMTAQDNSYTLNASFPAKILKGYQSADLDVTIYTEKEEESIGTLHLTLNADSMFVGTLTGTIDKPYSAGAVWTEDPHLGFSLFIEPGTINVKYNGDAFQVTGTTCNNNYNEYKEVIAAARKNGAKTDSINALTECYMHKYADSPLFGVLFLSHNDVAMAGFFSKDPEGDKQNVERLWAIGSDEAKKNISVIEKYNRVCHNDITNGEPLRDVEIPNATVEGTGETVRLSDYIGKGKWVFIDFWASWCGGCRQAIPLVKKAYEQVKNENIIFISIAEWDKRAAALKAMKEENMPWLQLIDEKGKCGSTYMFSTIPRFMLFTPDGKLAEKDMQRNMIMDTLTSLFK